MSEIERRGRVLYIELEYPRNDDNPNIIEIGLSDVRAADSIHVSYDFDRDGWAIKQASTFAFEADDEVRDEDWQEAAFVRSWAREKT